MKPHQEKSAKTMNDQKSESAPTWGYRLYPHPHSHVPGYFKMEVNLRAEPTGHHFDPEQVHLDVILDPIGYESLTLSHPWTGATVYQVIIGRILLTDRKKETVTFFSYGGKLNIDNSRDLTVCTIESPAPILRPVRFTSIASLLADQTEILLAERRAKDLPDLVDYENYVAHATPAEIYLETLRLLDERMRDEAYKDGTYIHDFADFLRHEKTDFQPARLSP